MQHFQMPDRRMLWDLFQMADTNRSGFITCEELQAILTNGTASPFNPETIRLMIGMYDRRECGSISFQDFSDLWQYVNDWQNCFRSFDRDNSGNIDRIELKNALVSFGYRISDSIIDILLTKFDRFGNGTILFDDFIQCCIVLQTLTAAFRQHDTNMNGSITINYEQFLKMVFELKI